MTLTNRPTEAPGRLRLGSELDVNRLGFGVMQLPGPGCWGPPRDRRAALAVLRRAVELGVDYIDTSDFYGPHVANELIREALHPYRDDLVIGTKVGVVRDGRGDWRPAGSPDQLRTQIEQNLTRLGKDRLELVYLRVGGDGLLPAGRDAFGESVAALVELHEQGVIGALGLSGVTTGQLRQALATTSVVAVQNRFNLLDRGSADVLRLCEENGVAFVPYFPLAAGTLGPGGRGLPFGPTLDRARAKVLDRIADAHQATRAQVSIAWLLAHSPTILVIPGTSSVAHLEENLAAGGLRLSEAEVAALDALA
ncbi:oxidoreductase [Micromonospora echinofusca]|uniref:oxidoreductase n=1 Tax=Micromonospora echinofusca TaxID=47858 RepID=UPI0034152923